MSESCITKIYIPKIVRENMLYLIGLGLKGDDIPYSGIEAVKKCSKVYCETYTSILGIEKEKLEGILGVRINFLKRKDVEEKNFIIEEAEKENICFLVPGDPLAATTHIDLVLRARKRGINVKIIHAASIFSAVSETGLQLYKFGKTASIAYPEEKFFPKSFYDTIISNKERGLHTLLLLDIKAEEKRYMSPDEAFEILGAVDKNGIIKKIVVVSRVGRDDQKIIYGDMNDLKSYKYGDPPHCIIIPGELHFMEEEFLNFFKVKK